MYSEDKVKKKIVEQRGDRGDRRRGKGRRRKDKEGRREEREEWRSIKGEGIKEESLIIFIEKKCS